MYKSKNKWSSVGLYIFLGIILVFMIVPFIWLVISSFRPNADLFTEPFSIPKTLSVDNFRAVLESQPMLLYFRNTVMIALIATFIGNFSSIWNDGIFFLKKNFDSSIFYVSIYSNKCIFSAVLCYD